MTQAVIQTTVTGMQGRPIATTVPAANQTYTWSGAAWVPTGPYLPLAGGILTGALRLQYAAPVALIYNDTTQSITAGGLFRVINSGGALIVQSNTATAGDFSTVTTPLQLNPSGSVNVGNGLGVSGGLSATGNLTISGSTNLAGPTTMGNAQVGNGSPWGVGTAGVLQVSNTSGQTMAIFNGVGQAAGAGCILFRVDLNFNAYCLFLFGNGQVGSITTDSVSTYFNTSSDGRLKTDVAAITSAYSGATIDALAPVSFEWASDPGLGLNYGFVAQDAQAVFPTAVREGLGNPGDAVFTPWSMDLSKLMPVAIAELKALRGRVAALETKVGA